MFSVVRNLLKLIPKKIKKRLPIVYITMLIGALLETLSISLLVPLVSVILGNEDSESSLTYKIFSLFIPQGNTGDYTLILFIVIILIFIGKNIFLYYQIYIQAKFSSDVRHDLQNRLYTECIKKPYEYYLTTNMGGILRNIYNDTMGVYNALVNFLMVLIDDSCNTRTAIL